MAFFSKTLGSNRFQSFLSRQNPSPFPSKIPSFHFPISQDLVFRVSARRISSLPAREILTHASDEAIETESKPPEPSKSSEITPKTNAKKKKKPLHLFFREAVGLIEKTKESELPEEDSEPMGVGEMKKKLRNLEIQVRDLKSKKDETGGVEAESYRLYSLFAKPSSAEKKPGAEGVGMVGSGCALEELAPEMVSLLDRLFKEGYLADGNFMKDGKLNLNCLSSSFSQDYLKFAVERFGEDHEEIAKWLSGSDLKKLALFGCPSIERKTVFAAKSLRSYFSIHEDTVCRACKLKSSCKFEKQRVVKRKKLLSSDALRVLTVYGLGSVPQQLVLTDEIKFSVNKLLKQVVNLSK